MRQVIVRFTGKGEIARQLEKLNINPVIMENIVHHIRSNRASSHEEKEKRITQVVRRVQEKKKETVRCRTRPQEQKRVQKRSNNGTVENRFKRWQEYLKKLAEEHGLNTKFILKYFYYVGTPPKHVGMRTCVDNRYCYASEGKAPEYEFIQYIINKMLGLNPLPPVVLSPKIFRGGYYSFNAEKVAGKLEKDLGHKIPEKLVKDACNWVNSYYGDKCILK